MQKIVHISFLLCASVLGLLAQTDSIIRQLDQLGLEDILLDDSLLTSTRVAAASRSLQQIEELPFPIFVIDRDEIVNNGYITLVDALKSMPGIRVSQPGSALEGETFTMRGLLGNTYAKILINGNPIKPYVVSGMPIGAQLPIQQAERIEVIYGPAAALYGADASSGIINIVMADSERPVFTKASLHIGSDSYKSLNLLFGGKIGRGNNVVRFKLFGMDTRFDDRRIFYDQDMLYNTANYLGRISSINNIISDINYRGTLTNPNIQNTPHESRTLGVEAHYKFLSFGAIAMDRSDHSSIGYNPAAVSYANPLINTGENINSAYIKSRFNINKLQLETKFEFLSYAMNNGSSNLFIHPMLNALLYNTILDTTANEMVQTQIEENFFSRIRYMGANSDEYSIEQTLNAPIFVKGLVTAGLKYTRGNGQTIRDFQSNIINFQQNELENLNPAFSDENIEEFSLFIQLFQPLGDQFNLLIGGQYLNRENGDFASSISTFNPRLALLYKHSDALQFRTSYSTAIRAPSPYFNATSYTFEANNYENLAMGINQLEAERTQSYELGMRWDIFENVDLDLSLSYTNTDEFINYNVAFDELGPNQRLASFTLGYFNDENSRAELFDAQAYLCFREIIPSVQLGGTFSINVSNGRESLTTTNVADFNNEVRQLSGLRAHPSVISRFSLFAYPISRLRIAIDQYYASKSLTRNSFRLNAPPDLPENALSIHNDGYYTIDLIINYNINRNFLFYAKFLNILNSKYAGIDASSSNDILFYNPQSQFIFRIGLNYELN